jgi:hypothetical protein
VESFERDWTKLAQLTGGVLEKLTIIGGEPLLHPDLLQFIRISRDLFKTTTMYICTNGLLLTKMNEDFWECCRDNNAELLITRYPVNINERIIKAVADAFNVRAHIYPDTPRVMQWTPIDISGSQCAQTKFGSCWHKSDCPKEIRDGKVWGCILASHVHNFNAYFEENVEVSEQDYIDIHGVTSYDEIMQFMSKPFPICRYCKWAEGRIESIWKPSKREIGEWT